MPACARPTRSIESPSKRLGSVGLAGLLLGAVAAPVLAHEQRDVSGYSFEVGLIGEPVFVGQRSGLEFQVTKDDKPISGLDKTLKAEVIYGDATQDLPLTERAAEDLLAGHRSVFIPTSAGQYTFHIAGDIDGTAIDESFTSGPTGFDEVQEATAGQFPSTLPTVTELSAEAKKGADAASLVPIALALGAGGLIVGLLGLGIGLAGRRPPPV